MQRHNQAAEIQMNENSSMFLLLRDQNYFNSKRSQNSLAKKSVTYENLYSDSHA
jgi:hypothetical protein